MNKVQKMRFWLNEAKNFQTNMDELWGFMRMPKKSTGLPYDIYVDNGGMYKNYNHELWLYVQIGNEKIPITISEKPVVKKLIRGKSNLENVYYFIIENRVLLKKLADDEASLDAFFALLRRYPDFLPKNMLNEMATLRPKDSHLPAIIWLDDAEHFQGHAPRIKFQPNPQETNTNNFPSMEIRNPENIYNMDTKKCQLTTDEIAQIQAFVAANEELLMKLITTEIGVEEFKANMTFVDKNGKIIPKPAPTYFKLVNGFSKVFFNGKYDFVDKNNVPLIGDFVFDDADNFADYGNGVLIARVVKNGKEMFIDTEGKEVEF